MEIISGWELYLWTRIDSLGFMLGLVLVLVGVFGVICFAAHASDRGKMWPWERSRFVVVPFVVLSVIQVLLPSQKDLAMIYVIPKIVNNQSVQQEAGEIYTIAKQALMETLGQVKEESKKGE